MKKIFIKGTTLLFFFGFIGLYVFSHVDTSRGLKSYFAGSHNGGTLTTRTDSTLKISVISLPDSLTSTADTIQPPNDSLKLLKQDSIRHRHLLISGSKSGIIYLPGSTTIVKSNTTKKQKKSRRDGN